MFQSIKLIVPKDETSGYRFEITDSDFIAIIDMNDGDKYLNIGAIIREYGARGLNVPLNVVLYCLWKAKNGGASFDSQVRWAIESAPELKTELEKYLALV